MNQTRRKDHQASSGRAITSRRRAERTGERAGVDEAMAGGLGWTRQGAEPRGKERTEHYERYFLGERMRPDH